MTHSTPNREEFRKRLREMFEKTNIKVGPITPDAVIIATRVEDFDMASNDLWELEANKSFPRDITCSGCGKQLVMSNGAFAQYETNGRNNKVLCIKDAVEIAVDKDLKPKLKS